MSGSVADLVNRIHAARESVDGAEVKGQQLYVSEKEFIAIFESYLAARGDLDNLIATLDDMQGEAGSKEFDAVQMKHLVAILKESGDTDKPVYPPEMPGSIYATYVARVAADLDG